MIKESKSVVTTAVLLVSLLVPGAAGGKVILNADNGASERIVDSTGKLKNDLIGVVWLPELDPMTSSFGVTGSCKRADAGSGEFVGNNKVKFSRVSIESLSSGFFIDVPNFKSTMKNGLPNKVQVVDITAQVRQMPRDEVALLGGAQAKLTGTVDAGDYIQCFFGIVEGDVSLIPLSVSAAQRQAALEEISRTTIFRDFTPEFE